MKKLFVALRAIVCLALAVCFGWFSYLSCGVFADRKAQRKDNDLIAKLNAVVDGSVPNSYDDLLARFAENGVRKFTLTQREPWLFYSSSRNAVLPYNEWIEEGKAYSYRYAELDFDRERFVARVISSEPYSCDYLLTADADIAALLASLGQDLPAVGNALEGEILGYVLTHTVFYGAEGEMFRYERSEDGYAVKRVLNAKSEEFVGYSLVLLDGVKEAPLGFFEGSYFYRLYLPDSVAEITPGAFKDCRHLESVRLPSEMREISRSAFENCVSLTEVVLPRCRKIGISAFAGCTGLTRLTLSSELTVLAASSFENVPNLSLVVYDGTRAQYETIADRIPLKEGGTLSLGTAITPSLHTAKGESGELVYDGAIGRLEEATFAYGGGKPKEVGENAFAYASDLRCATFADSFAVIGANAFYGSGLFSVSIGKGVASIGKGAFSACHNLTNLSVSPANPRFASADGVLFGLDGEEAVLICFPSGYRGDYTLPAFVNIGGKSRKVTRIENSAIVCAHELTRFALPSGVTVGENNFIDCPKAVVV